MTTNTDVKVSIEHLYKHFGSETAVKDFNLDIT